MHNFYCHNLNWTAYSVFISVWFYVEMFLDDSHVVHLKVNKHGSGSDSDYV